MSEDKFRHQTKDKGLITSFVYVKVKSVRF